MPWSLTRGAAVAVAIAGVLAADGDARATVTIGSDLANPPTGLQGCAGGAGVTCVVVQTAIPGRQLASPIDGVITRFRSRGGSGSARLRIVHPGPAGYTFVSSTPYVTGSGGTDVVTLPAQVPIHAGDLIGVDGAPGAQAGFRPLAGATADYFEPSPADGATMPPTFPANGNEFLFNADVEPDTDNDGFGDETQDGCPGNGSATGTCPPPKEGSTVNVEQVKGKVLVKAPGQSGFTELTNDGQIPVGAVVDVTKGTVRLTSASDSKGATQTGDFYDGIFKVGQAKGSKPITELTLVGDLTCKKSRLDPDLRPAATSRRLWGRAKGRFRTRGRRSAATVRGTTWLVEDRCDGTLTRVKEGTVVVSDFRLKRDIKVPAGKTYLAK